MQRISGLKLLDERGGTGAPAKKGDRVLYNTRIFLNQSDQVPLNEKQAEHFPKEMIRVENGVTFVDHIIRLGQRETIAGVEHALMGMKDGGYRKVRISRHLAYRDKGIQDLVPPDAVLIVGIWLRGFVQERKVHVP